jgi:hypothetical protein
MSKRKFTKQEQKVHDQEDNKKFLVVVAVATLVLVALMYFMMQ